MEHRERVELWTGLPGAGRREAAVGEAHRTALAGGTVWWVVDGQRRGERVEEMLVDSGSGALAGVEVVVAGRLAMRILEATGRNVQATPVEVRDLLLSDILASTAITSQLDRDLSPGWSRRIGDLYVRLQQGEEGLAGHLRTRYPWALDAIERYRARLADAGLVDEADLSRIAAESMTVPDFPAPSLLIVDRPGPLPPPVVDLLHLLAGAAERTVVLLDGLDRQAPALHLAHLDGVRWRERHPVAERRFTPPPGIEALALRFCADPLPEGEAPPVDRTATLMHHTDPAAEVRTVAAEISRLLHDEGVGEKRIAVACTSLDSYAPYVEELFARYGVRPDLRLGVPLSTSPVARLAAALFELRAHGLSREGLTDLLMNPYASWETLLATDAGVLSFDSAARNARITDGRGTLESAWIAPLREEAGRLHWRAREAVQDVDGDEEENAAFRTRDRLEAEAEWLEGAIREFGQLGRLLLSLPDPCTVDEALEWVRSVMRRLGVRDGVLRAGRADPRLGQRDILALGHVNLTLQHVATALRLQRSTRWPVERFAELFHYGIATARLSPGRRLRGGVAVMGPLDLRGLDVDHLFFLGLTADSWPRSPEIDLADPFAGRWTQVDRLAESRALMLEAFFASRHLVLSTPSPEKGEGRQAPSPLLAEVAEAGVNLEPPEERSVVYRSALDLLPDAGRGLVDPNDRALALRRLAAAKSDAPHGEVGVNWGRALQAVRVEAVRGDARTLTRYEGYLSGEPVADDLARRALANPLSVTRLDAYAACPMRFLFHHILKLEELKEVEEEADAASRGELVHKILAEAARRMRNGNDGADFSSDPERTARVLADVANEEIDRQPYDNLFWDRTVHDLVDGLLDNDANPGYLRRVVNAESGENRIRDERILFAEASFGQPAGDEGDELLRDPLVIRRNGVSVPLAGRIDRISRHPDKGWRIWDYKLTGYQLPSSNKVLQGTSFQLPVYLWALERWRDEGHGNEWPIDMAAYYQMKPDKISVSGKWTRENHEAHGLVLQDRVVAIHGAIAAGRFHHPLSQHTDLCPDSAYNRCPFRNICRRDHTLFAARERHLAPRFLRDAYILGFQERHAQVQPGEGEA